jgi:hypothetical protein
MEVSLNTGGCSNVGITYTLPVRFCLFCLPILFCLSCSTYDVLNSSLLASFCLSRSAYHGLPVPFCLSNSACPVCLSCSGCPALPVQFCLSRSACPVLTVLSTCPVLPALSCLSCTGFLSWRIYSYFDERARKETGSAEVRAQKFQREEQKTRSAVVQNREGKSSKFLAQKRTQRGYAREPEITTRRSKSARPALD